MWGGGMGVVSCSLISVVSWSKTKFTGMHSSSCITDDQFLQALGGVKNNSLVQNLDTNNSENDEDDYIQIIRQSSYYDKDKLDNLLKSTRKCFSVFSTNIQNIKTKFDELKIFLDDLRERHNFEFSVICLQECQFSEKENLTRLKLNNYKPIPQGHKLKNPCSTKGGLFIYLHENFKGTTINTLHYSTWEGQVIKITNGGLERSISLANIYRPPNDINEKYRQFIQEISPILASLEHENSECMVLGDFNINLLKLNEKEVFEEFFDTLTENSFYPKITMPTRFTIKHGTLIDNIFCKLTDKSIDTTSGILIKKFSDHQPYFSFLTKLLHKEPPCKYVKLNTQNIEAIQKFENELISVKLVEKMDINPLSDPNISYNILHTAIETAKNEHIPCKLVKFNK